MEKKFAIRVKKRYAEQIRQRLIEKNIFDQDRKIVRLQEFVELPILNKFAIDDPSEFPNDVLGLEAALIKELAVIEQATPETRAAQLEPIEIIYNHCHQVEPNLPEHILERLPRKWELLGDVLIVKFPNELEVYLQTLSKIYAEVLGAVTVLRETETIKGPLREPTMEILYGERTETVHKENGVLFKLDAANLIFSSGNIDERERMAFISNSNETVVDLFAGIGYFTLQIAVHSQPAKIYACELNPIAYQYLQENIQLNKVEGIIEPILGDNRETAPENVADRVIMGYIKNTHEFLPKAIKVLKKEGGIIHYHDTCPNELLPAQPLERVQKIASDNDRAVKLLNYKNIKSYAPGISHVVLDVEVKSIKG